MNKLGYVQLFTFSLDYSDRTTFKFENSKSVVENLINSWTSPLNGEIVFYRRVGDCGVPIITIFYKKEE